MVMGPVLFDEMPPPTGASPDLYGGDRVFGGQPLELSPVQPQASNLPVEPAPDSIQLRETPSMGGISTASDLAVRDVVNEERGKLERWRKRLQAPPPPRMMDQSEWVQRNLPEITRQRFVSPTMLDHIDRSYQRYMAKEEFLADYELARQRQRPSGLDVVREAALDDLSEKYGDDSTKVLEAFNDLARADKQLTALQRLEAETIQQLRRKTAGAGGVEDPAAAMAALMALKEDKGDSPDEVRKLRSQAAAEAAQGIEGPGLQGLKTYSRAQSTAAETSLVTPAAISDVMTQDTIESESLFVAKDGQGVPWSEANASKSIQGLSAAIKADPIGGWALAVEKLTPLMELANAETRTKIEGIIAKTRPSQDEVEKAYKVGYFHRPEDKTWGWDTEEELNERARQRSTEFMRTHGYAVP